MMMPLRWIFDTNLLWRRLGGGVRRGETSKRAAWEEERMGYLEPQCGLLLSPVARCAMATKKQTHLGILFLDENLLDTNQATFIE